MEVSAIHNFRHFLKAAAWSETWERSNIQIQDAHHSLLMLSSTFTTNININSTAEGTNQQICRAERNIIKELNNNRYQPDENDIVDKFRPYFLKLSFSQAARPDIHSTDQNGTHLTIEGRIHYNLLQNSQHQPTIISIQGPGGVGKTTTLHMISQQSKLHHHFTDGVYYIKLGAEATFRTAINQITNIVKISGGAQLASKIQSFQTVEKATNTASEWFWNKKFLLLVDDVWEHNQLGSSIVSSLEDMIIGGDSAAMVFTTRDPEIASTVKVFQILPRDLHSLQSRHILLRHAQQDDDVTYDKRTEQVILELLTACIGLPVAHSVAGKGVLRYFMRPNVRIEDAWRLYHAKQENIIDMPSDKYDSLVAVFGTALSVLDDFASSTDPNDCKYNKEHSCENRDSYHQYPKYTYREMHRALCVLEKQQTAPIEMLSCLWNIDDLILVEKICSRFVRSGLAEWHHLNNADGNQININASGILIHDLLHDYVCTQADKHGESILWHKRLIERYATRLKRNDNIANQNNEDDRDCRQWWTINELNHRNFQDGNRPDGYLLNNVCRHLSLIGSLNMELGQLVTRPEWISTQLVENGLLQYEQDVSFAYASLLDVQEINERNDGIHRINKKHSEVTTSTTRAVSGACVSLRMVKLIHNAVRLSAGAVMRNPREVWFQIYGRLIAFLEEYDWVKNYLRYIELHAPKPWIKPLGAYLHRPGTNFEGQILVDGYPSCLTGLPRKSLIFCGGGDGSITIINVKTYEVVKQWKAHEKKVRTIAISRSGKLLVTGSDDNSAKIWNVWNWDQRGTTLNGHEIWVTCVAISSNDKYVFTGSLDETIRMWNIEDGTCIRQVYLGLKHTLSGLPLSRRIMKRINGDNYGSEYEENRYPIEIRVSEDISKVTALTTNIGNRRILIWDISSYKQCNKTSYVSSVVPQQNCEKKLRLLRRNDTSFHDLQVISNDVKCLCLNKNGTKMIAEIEDGTFQMCEVFNMRPVGHAWKSGNKHIYRVMFSDDDQKVLCRYPGIFTVRDSMSGMCLFQYSNLSDSILDIGFLALNGDEKVVSCGSSTVRVWNISKPIAKQQENKASGSRAQCVALIPDRSECITGHEDGNICLWDTHTGSLLRKSLLFDEECIGDIAVTPDGKRIVLVNSHDVGIINTERLELINRFNGHNDCIHRVDIPPDGEIAITGSHDKTIRVWDLMKCDGSHITIDCGNWVRNVFSSTDGKRVLAVHYNDSYVIRVWDIATRQCITEIDHSPLYPTQKEEVMKVAGEYTELTSEGRVLCRNNRELIFEGNTDCLVSATVDVDLHQLCFSEENNIICAVDWEGNVLFLRVESEP